MAIHTTYKILPLSWFGRHSTCAWISRFLT